MGRKRSGTAHSARHIQAKVTQAVWILWCHLLRCLHERGWGWRRQRFKLLLRLLLGTFLHPLLAGLAIVELGFIRKLHLLGLCRTHPPEQRGHSRLDDGTTVTTSTTSTSTSTSSIGSTTIGRRCRGRCGLSLATLGPVGCSIGTGAGIGCRASSTRSARAIVQSNVSDRRGSHGGHGGGGGSWRVSIHGEGGR